MEINLIKIAVIMTCHNRKNTSLSCLYSLFNQYLSDHVKIEVYLVDDGSTDGTSTAIKTKYPKINILKGNGNLFWNGGMRLAFGKALKEEYDYYLWLNDDTLLFRSALNLLLKSSLDYQNQYNKQCVVVGSTMDSKNYKHTYGGKIQTNIFRPLSFTLIKPKTKFIRCDVFNGNCVLIPKKIANIVGNLSKKYTHGLGDYDYSFRVRDKGYHSIIAPGYVGTCSNNSRIKSCKNKKLSSAKRVYLLSNIKDIPPPNEYLIFIKRNAGIFWIIYYLRTYLRKLFPKLWVLLR